MIIFKIFLDPGPAPDPILFSDPDPLEHIISEQGGSESDSRTLPVAVLVLIFSTFSYSGLQLQKNVNGESADSILISV
jgi:hypothetical protein